MCGTMADIQSAMAEIRRGKKRRKKEVTTGHQTSVLTALMTGWPQAWKTWNTLGFLQTWKTHGILCNLREKL